MENALEYDAVASGVFAPLYPVVAEAILERTGVVSGRMLDVGCGGGHLGFAVMERAPFEGWLVDVSPDAVKLCRERSLGMGLGDRCRCLVGDVHALPLEDAFFDLVVRPIISRFGIIQSTVFLGRLIESPMMFSIIKAMVENPTYWCVLR